MFLSCLALFHSLTFLTKVHICILCILVIWYSMSIVLYQLSDQFLKLNVNVKNVKQYQWLWSRISPAPGSGPTAVSI